MLPGIRVLRGPDWCFGDQDGGPGYLGTVIHILSNNTVTVQWDIGSRTTCRAGQKGQCDLRIYDNAQLGIEGVFCNNCDNRQSFYGIRWKCLVCYDIDYCTPCYMSSKKCISHPFVRYFTKHSVIVRVPPRSRSKKIPLYGIFEGAKVTTLTSGGCINKQVADGTVKELVNMEQSYRSAVKVEWSHKTGRETTESDLPLYRVGAEGKVELKLLSAVSPGTVFTEHLPVLDLTVPTNISYQTNDIVRMDKNLETFKALIKEHVGWTPELEKVLGEEGIITEIVDRDRHIVSVKYDHLNFNVRTMYTNVLTKVTKVASNDYVDVITDEVRMKELQQQHGGWHPSLKSILGATGKVLRLEGSTECIVEVKGKRFLLNILCLKPRKLDSSLSGSLRGEKYLQLSQGDMKYIGVRVVRGPHWSPDFGKQDGGEGHVGTVVEVYGSKTDSNHPQQCVVVQWDSGEKNVYRAGLENVYDLRIIDNASMGVKHNKDCSECKIDTIFGMLWKCRECQDINLCSECYNKDAHNIHHKFIRIESVDDAEGTEVPKRAVSKKLIAYGIYEKCKVRRGPDWRWFNQDGGEDKHGEVIAVVNFSPDTERDAVEVTWENGYTNVYRLGYRGRLDVVCVSPVPGGYYYKDHVPILRLNADVHVNGDGEAMDINDKEEVIAEEETKRFSEGDKVRIEIDVDVLKMIEENRGAWNHRMTECIGHMGTVKVVKGNDITVDFQNAGKWTFHESVLNKVQEFVPGETVKVKDNLNTVQMLQSERGGWNDLMIKVIGKNGTIESIDEDGDVAVCFGDYTWTFHPECIIPTLEKADFVREADPEPVVTAPKSDTVPTTLKDKLEELFEVIMKGETDRINGIIQRNPELTVMDIEGRYAVHCAAKCGRVDIINVLFSTASAETLLEMKDNRDMTPLLTAVDCDQLEMVRHLVSMAANKDVVNKSHHGAVHIAVIKQSINMLNLLRELGFDPNMKDKLNQSPLFEAINQDDESITMAILEWPGIDIHYTDSIGFSPFFYACRKGQTWVVEKILRIRPDEIIEKKDDGFTGLHLATFNGNKHVVDVLIKQTNVDIDAVNMKGMTCAHLACSAGLVDIITTLGNNGADMTLKTSTEQNVLHLYFQGVTHRKEDNYDMFRDTVDFLMKCNVDVNAKDSSNKLPEDYLENDGLKTLYGQIKDAWFRKKGAATGGETENNQTPLTESLIPKPANPDTENIMPNSCDSCEETQIRFRVTPCGHYLCEDCAPRKKQKKKLCGSCGENCTDVTEIEIN
ncbi:E3 ubiquitin-protein ligase mib2 [Mactra antiquata]